MTEPTWRSSSARALTALARPLMASGEWVGKVSSWLVIGVALLVLTTVLLNALGINEVARWQDKVLLLGDAITINSVTEMQWHLFGLLTLLGGTYALHHDTHVRVDLVYHGLSQRNRAIIDVLGHLIFLLPFCVLIAWLSRHFVEMSFVSHEQSNYGGLTDRWIIKAALPLGLLFLAVNALGQVLENIAFLLDPTQFPDRLEKAHAG
ncbi:TRAP transporter small permease subunit [Pokkaliibacter sp. MBI-7]|nr:MULTISPECIES: TRAP transporter small permease subunit [Pokkaliibacter]MDH2432063.1 TRAP transporter small permease subunit [Pokkaliibacter sp. MBI-7]